MAQVSNDVRLKDWGQNDRQSGRTLAFGLWNGRISVQVYETQNMKNKLFRRNLQEDEIVLVEKLIAQIVSGSPEQKKSIQFMEYDKNSKQFKLNCVLEMGKDSKQVYHITISDVTKQQTYTFTLKARATMQLGSEPMSEGNLSAIKVETLKNWLTSAKVVAPFTVQPVDPSKRGGGYGGGHGGGYNGGGAPSQPAPSGDGGDGGLPF